MNIPVYPCTSSTIGNEKIEFGPVMGRILGMRVYAWMPINVPWESNSSYKHMTCAFYDSKDKWEQ